MPANIDRRQATLDRKREEYHNFVKQYYPTRYEDTYHDTFRQVQHVIVIDNLSHFNILISYPCQCFFFCCKIIPTDKLRVSECVRQCQKQTTQSMLFIICSTDSHRYPKNKPSHSSFSTAFGTGGKSRVISFNIQHQLCQFSFFKLLFQCLVPENTHTSPMGGISSKTHPPLLWKFLYIFLAYRHPPPPHYPTLRNSNPFCGGLWIFLELHNRTFLHLEKQCSQINVSADALAGTIVHRH